MLDSATKRRIDTARDILVGKVPDPKSQVEQITIALIYKFMDDMDAEAEELGGERKFFAGDFARFGWPKLMRSGLSGFETLNLYAEAISKMPQNGGIPPLFRDIFKNAYLPYRDPETLKSFLKVIDEFTYDHSEKLGDAFEYLLSVLGSQGTAGQFRTPRHIIDFITDIVDPKKDETILDPACGTAGFLISAYKHILAANVDNDGHSTLTPDDRGLLAKNIRGYDISPDMVRLSLVNLYLHNFREPRIDEYDTLTSEDKWNERFDVILANPPFMSPKGGIKPHRRFSVQSSRSEVLFVDYIAEHLTSQGRAGIIVPEGIIFQSGTSYKALRKMLVENYLVAVISLPAGVFNPYSGVKTSILIFDKALAKKSDTIGFFKIENDGFGLGAQRRAIGKNDLPQVKVEIAEYIRRLRVVESLEHFSPTLGYIVPKEKIAENGDYNLSGERYRDNVTHLHSFPLVALGDSELFKIESGGTPKSEVDEYWRGGIPWATLVDLPASDFITEINVTQRTISEQGLKNSSAKLIPANSIIVSTRATIGRIALNRIALATNQGFKNIIVQKPQSVIPEFLALMLTKLVPTMKAWATGGTFAEISKSKFSELQIPLPPLDVQQEIVAEIEGYQKVIDGARAVLENYRPHIPINAEWPMHSISAVSRKITKGSSPNWQGISYTTKGNGILFITSENIGLGQMIMKKPKYVERRFNEIEPKSILEKGDVLTNIVGASIGRTAIFDLDEEANINQAVCIIRPDTALIDSTYLMTLLNSPDFIERLLGNSVENARANISMGVLGGLTIPVPLLDIQQQIVEDIQLEQNLVEGNRVLIELFEKKIQSAIARVWGEDETEKPVEIKGINASLLLIEPEYSKEQWQDAVTYYFTHHLHKDPHFMRTKRHKMTYIAETAYQLPLGGEYHREGAGPLDINMLTPLEERMAAKDWIRTKEWEGDGKHGVHYSLGSESKKALAESRSILGEKTADLDRLIEIFKKFNTKTSEKIATLFAVWNDFLIQGKSPSDNEILDEVWNNWNDSKKKIPRQEWSETLNWMKQNNFVPPGKGPRTKRKVAIVRGK